MGSGLSVVQATRAFYLLTFTRWISTGMVVGIFLLWALELGLTTTQALTATAMIGWTVAVLELPTSGFTDVFGRRPVMLVAATVQVVAGAAYALAGDPVGFGIAASLFGVFRALDSGPLEAWFVDAVHVHEPGKDVDQPLARAGTVAGLTMATMSLVSSGLIVWHPIESRSALELPFLCFIGLAVVHVVAVWFLMPEVRHLHIDANVPELAEQVDPERQRSSSQRAWDSVRATPGVVRTGLRLVFTSPVLLGVVLAELFWSIGLIGLENLTSILLADMTGSLARAGELMGPVAAGAWGVFAVGSTLSGLTSKRIGVARTALIGRLVHSGFTVLAGVVAGPIALIAVHLLGYSGHGFLGPAHFTLVHRVAPSSHRATVLSINSLAGFLGFAIGAPLTGALADATSTGTAMATVGAISLLGFFGYLPALRAERLRGHDEAPRDHTSTVAGDDNP